VPRWVIWLAAAAPALVARTLVGLGLANWEQLIAGVLALAALVLLVRRPAPALACLVVLLPFHLLLTSMLYELGLSGGVTRMAALWKELVVLAVAVAAWQRSRGRTIPTDAFDRVAAAFVVLGTLYLLLPEVFVGQPGSDLSVDTRFVAWRLVVLPSVLALAARRLCATADEVRTVLRGVTVVAVALGTVAVVEFFFSGWWNRLLVDTIGVNRYRVEVLEIDLRSLGLRPTDIRVYGEVAGRRIIRIGGPMVSHLNFSFVLLIAVGLLAERLVRGLATRAVAFGVVACGLGLLFTQTRSSIAGAVVLLAVVLLPAPGRATVDRVRYGLVGAMVAVVAVPVLFLSGLTDRFTEGDELSDAVHEVRVDNAVDTVIDHPLGLGIGMGSVAGGRPAEGSVSVENQVLDTAVQLGVLGSALLIAQYFLLIAALRRAAVRAGPVAQAATFAVRTVMLGLLVSLWYQLAFGVIEVSWILFGLAGLALGAAEGDAARADEDAARDHAEPEPSW
jgi:hypothetical protein